MMKLLINICIFLCFPFSLFSQVKPDATSVPPTSTATLPVEAVNYSDSTRINFVRTWTARGPFKIYETPEYTNSEKYQQTTSYFDGLGRPLEEVIKAGSPNGTKDIVVPHVYDAFGREATQFLPYPVTPTTAVGLAGEFKATPFTDQPAYYQNTYSDANPYSQTVFEASPLNRAAKAFAPGGSWAGSLAPDQSNQGQLDNEHAVRKEYLINTAVDAVRIWSTDFNINLPAGIYSMLPYTPSIYEDGKLYKNVTIDEHKKQVVEYIDKEGRIILKKVQISDVPSAGHTGWLCTYYIYDDFGLLRFVLQPKAVEWLSSHNWYFHANGGNDIVHELSFHYEYDRRNRMYAKKIPGSDWTFMAYDNRDRLIATTMSRPYPKPNSTYILYDALNRPVATGEMRTSAGQMGLAILLANISNIEVIINAQPGLTESFKAWCPIVTSANLVDVYSDAKLNTITYYDDYSFANAATFNTAQLAMAQSNSNVVQGDEYIDYSSPSILTKGLVTGTKTRILDNGTITWLTTTIFYDDKGRVIQSISTNSQGGIDIVTTQYSFTGNPLTNILRQQKGGTSPEENVILTRNTYLNGQLIKTGKKINADSWKVISEQAYDDLGKLKTKKLAAEYNSSQGLETLTYDYNVRGWLTGINRGFANTAGSTDHYFGMELNYDWGFSQKQFNGNIAGSKWKSRGDGEQRAYGYSYDAANRILQADFTQNTAGWNQSAGVNFNVIMGNLSKPAYDANGNIGAMQQWGIKPSGSLKVDDLVYTYKGTDQYSNKLLAVNENSSTTDTHLGDFTDKNTGLNDYDYDFNGNLTFDNNKNITSISYNLLNLPEEIVLTGNRNIKYLYDAAGNKHQKIVTEQDQPTKTTSYAAGGIVYENEVLQMIGQDEGRIRPVRNAGGTVISYAYDYFIKDHLGNVRAVITDEQQQDNYPIATLESATIATEEEFYDNLNVGITNPAPAPFDGSNNTVQMLRKTSATVPAIGSSKLLKVMAGDKISAAVAYYYPDDLIDNGPANGLNSLVTMLTGLLNGSSLPAAVHGTGGAVATQLNNTTALATLFSSQGSGGSTVPKAYLNVVFFDEQFKYVPGESSCKQIEVNGSSGVQTLVIPNATVSKNGYAYVYVSNESNNFVYFDNFQVSHNRGPLLEETHYYPFGLTMSGISSKAAGKTENKKLYAANELQSKEFSDGSGLDFYDFNARTYDQQIGRFLQIDPLTDEGGQESWNPYHSCYNNPVRYTDPDGKIVWLIPYAAYQIIVAGVAAYATYKLSESVTQIANNVTKEIEQADVTITPSAYVSDSEYPLMIDPKTYIDSKLNMSTNAGSTAASNGLIVQMAAKKGPKDLVQEAKDAKAKEEVSASRDAKREAATRDGKNKPGQSNTDVKGNHTQGKQTPAGEVANARRAAEQAAAAAKEAAIKAAAKLKK